MKHICFMNNAGERRFVGFYEKSASGFSQVIWPTEDVGSPVPVASGKSAEQSLFEHLCVHNYKDKQPTDFFLAPLVNDYGEYHPRMYRPSFAGRRPMTELNHAEIFVKDFYKDKSNLHYQPYPIDDVIYSKAVNQLGVLKGALVELLRVIDPNTKNFNAFGTQIRNLLILACTEVESQWKGILRSNGYRSSGRDFNTNDYVKLLQPLRLNEYSVSLPLYPDCPPMEPFVSWSSLRPTKSLDWYDAYNSVKHDRELNFQEAKLQHAIQSVLAAAIMNVAQFGLREYWVEEFGSFFRFESVPVWKFEELYNFGPKSPITQKAYSF